MVRRGTIALATVAAVMCLYAVADQRPAVQSRLQQDPGHEVAVGEPIFFTATFTNFSFSFAHCPAFSIGDENLSVKFRRRGSGEAWNRINEFSSANFDEVGAWYFPLVPRRVGFEVFTSAPGGLAIREPGDYEFKIDTVQLEGCQVGNDSFATVRVRAPRGDAEIARLKLFVENPTVAAVYEHGHGGFGKPTLEALERLMLFDKAYPKLLDRAKMCRLAQAKRDSEYAGRYKPGDLDRNELIDVHDRQLLDASIRRHAAVSTDPKHPEYRDLNHDGQIDALDLQALDAIIAIPACGQLAFETEDSYESFARFLRRREREWTR